MPVHTVFVLDISTSMEGNKIVQLKKAMEAILRDLKPEDTFEVMYKNVGSIFVCALRVIKCKLLLFFLLMVAMFIKMIGK